MAAIDIIKKHLTDIGYGNQLKEPSSLKNNVIEIVPEEDRIKTFNDIAEKLRVKIKNTFFAVDEKQVQDTIGKGSFKSSEGAIIFPQSPFAEIAVKVIKGAAGSGPSTAEQETYSALCFAAKLLNNKTNYSLEELIKAKKLVKAKKNDPEKLFTKVVTQDWKDSSKAQTETFFDKMNLSGTNFTIELQKEGPITTYLYNTANKLLKDLDKNSKLSIYANIQKDKWNPGDIWIISSDISESDFNGVETIKSLNEKILGFFKQKKLIPISLKKVKANTTAAFEISNDGNTNFTGKYSGHDLGKKNGFSYTNNNMELYYKLVNTETKSESGIVRPFTKTDISFEIKGLAAAGGKAGRTFINTVLKSMGKKTVISYKDIDKAYEKNRAQLYEMFFISAKNSEYPPKENNITNFMTQIQKKYKPGPKERAYIIAKYQVTELSKILKTLKKSEKDTLVDKCITYASSTIKQVSSVFAKVGK